MCTIPSKQAWPSTSRQPISLWSTQLLSRIKIYQQYKGIHWSKHPACFQRSTSHSYLGIFPTSEIVAGASLGTATIGSAILLEEIVYKEAKIAPRSQVSRAEQNFAEMSSAQSFGGTSFSARPKLASCIAHPRLEEVSEVLRMDKQKCRLIKCYKHCLLYLLLFL